MVEKIGVVVNCMVMIVMVFVFVVDGDFVVWGLVILLIVFWSVFVDMLLVWFVFGFIFICVFDLFIGFVVFVFMDGELSMLYVWFNNLMVKGFL